MSQKRNYGIMAILVYAVIFIAYNLVVFLVFNNYTPVFWISYAFMLVFYFAHIFCAFYIGKDASVRAVFFGIPLVSFSLYFVIAELFCSLIFMIFRDRASVTLAILVQALLLCIFIVIAIISLMSRNAVQDTDARIKENVSFIKGICVDVEMLIQRSTDASTSEALNKLLETIKYSDPMSNSSVSIQEQMIMQNMMELRQTFDAGDMKTTQDLCGKIQLLFVERNKKLMVSK